MRKGFLRWCDSVSGKTLPALAAVAFLVTTSGCNSESAGSSVSAGQTEPAPQNPTKPEPVDPGPIPTSPPPVTSKPEGEKLLEKLVFTKSSKTYAPLNILSYHLSYRFSVENDTASATALIRFKLPANGNPYFFMNPSLSSAKIDGATVSSSRVSDPSGVNTYTALNKVLQAGDEHELEVRYTLSSAEFSTPSAGGVAFLVSFTDVSSWKFLNRYAPGNFESDQFPLTWDLELVDGPAAAQQIFANGKVSVLETNRKWRVEFPGHYTSSSFFLHFSSEKFTVSKLTHAGLTKSIPITLYSKDSALVTSAKSQIIGLFKELEAAYGPYAHDQFIAYLSGSSGGMEYVGATITSVPSLDHELLHSWFARGVMPAQGRSGWFDEAIASWRDYGYARTSPTLTRTATNLSNYSIYQGNTAGNSYSDGRKFMAELDMIFRDQGGYKAILKEFFAKHQLQTITTEVYLDFVQSKTTLNLKPYFDRYVYGYNSSQTVSDRERHEAELRSIVGEIGDHDLRDELTPPAGAGHPPALTPEEERALR